MTVAHSKARLDASPKARLDASPKALNKTNQSSLPRHSLKTSVNIKQSQEVKASEKNAIHLAMMNSSSSFSRAKIAMMNKDLEFM